MAVDYTTLDLIAKVKRHITVPTAQPLFLPADIVALLSEELHNEIVPLLMSFREEYFVANYDITPTDGVYQYAMSPRAIGAKLRDVVFVDAGGIEREVPRLAPETIKSSTPIPSPGLFGFYLANDLVTVYPGTVSLSGVTIRQKIFRRPNILLQRSQAGQVTALNTTTREATLSAVNTTWTTSTLFDVIQGTPPLFKSRGDDQTVTAIAGSVLTFSSLPTGMIVGDWVAEAGYSPIPQIPYEAFNLLVQRASIRVAEALKDTAGKKLAMDTYELMSERFKALVSPRVDGSPERVNNAGGIMDHAGSRRVL